MILCDARETGRRLAFAASLAAGLLAAGIALAGAPVETQLKNLGAVSLRGSLVVVSADGQHLAFSARKGDKSVVVVVDGKESPEYDQVKALAISNDGKHAAWAACRAGQWFIVVDGNELEHVPSVTAPAFSPDGRHVAYIVNSGSDKSYVALDAVPNAKYIATGEAPPLFSPDGRHLAYPARTSGLSKKYIVRDPNRPVTPNEPPPTWVTKDGKEVDMKGDTVARTAFLVVDDRKGERCSTIRFPTFSPNSRNTAYVAGFDNRWFVVLDEKRVSDLFEDVGPPVFSPDTHALVFPVLADKKWSVAGGRTDGEKFDGIQGLRFSPDGRHLAYAGQVGKQWLVACDGKKSALVDEIGWIGFSMDSAHLAYAARIGPAWVMVCDGVQGAAHQAILVPSGAASEALDKLRYVAVDTEARLVEITWPAGADWSGGLK